MMIISSILATMFTLCGLVISYLYDISSGASIIMVKCCCLGNYKNNQKKKERRKTNERKLKQGVVNTLKVNRVSEPGIYLISGDETEVLLQMLM